MYNYNIYDNTHTFVLLEPIATTFVAAGLSVAVSNKGPTAASLARALDSTVVLLNH